MSDSPRATRGFYKHLDPISLSRTLFAQRGIILQFMARNFHARHKGSYLGIGWAVLNPLLMLSLYFVVFAMIFPSHFRSGPDETRADVALALLVGLAVFHFLAEVIAQSPALIVGSPNLVKKVVFPVEILPVANLGACLVNFAISVTWVLIGMRLFGRGVPASTAWLPAIILPMVLLGAGLGWFLSALGVFFRDIAQITQLMSLLLMYTSAVFYPKARVIAVPKLWAVMRFNPVIHIIEMLRNTMLWRQPISMAELGWLYLGCGVVCLLGYACFATLRSSFADVL